MAGRKDIGQFGYGEFDDPISGKDDIGQFGFGLFDDPKSGGKPGIKDHLIPDTLKHKRFLTKENITYKDDSIAVSDQLEELFYPFTRTRFRYQDTGRKTLLISTTLGGNVGINEASAAGEIASRMIDPKQATLDSMTRIAMGFKFDGTPTFEAVADITVSRPVTLQYGSDWSLYGSNAPIVDRLSDKLNPQVGQRTFVYETTRPFVEAADDTVAIQSALEYLSQRPAGPAA